MGGSRSQVSGFNKASSQAPKLRVTFHGVPQFRRLGAESLFAHGRHGTVPFNFNGMGDTPSPLGHTPALGHRLGVKGVSFFHA
jgi:hypothetical protein